MTGVYAASMHTRWAAVMACLVLGATGCASAEDAGGTATPSPSAPTSEATSEPLPCVPGAEPFSGAAAETFGQERVMEAYCMLAGLAEEQGRTSLALLVPEQKSRDVDALRELLTPEAARRWRDWMQERATAGRSPIDGLKLHDVRRPPPGYQRADDGPYVYGTQVGPATAEVARGGTALRLTFQLDTGLVLEKKGDDDGRHLLLPVTRRGSYVLVLEEGGGWLVDEWSSEFEHGAVQLVSG